MFTKNDIELKSDFSRQIRYKAKCFGFRNSKPNFKLCSLSLILYDDTELGGKKSRILHSFIMLIHMGI